MSSFGLKISKDNYNVFDAEDKNLSFTSKNNMFKVFMAGTIQLELTNTGGPDIDEVEITHNLGYKPAFFLFGNNYGDGLDAGINRLPNNKAAGFECIYGISKENTLLIKINSAFSTSAQTFNVKYFLMIDKLAD